VSVFGDIAVIILQFMFLKRAAYICFLIDNSTKNLHTLFPSHNLVEELINR